MMVAHVFSGNGCVVPPHSHLSLQMIYILGGCSS